MIKTCVFVLYKFKSRFKIKKCHFIFRNASMNVMSFLIRFNWKILKMLNMKYDCLQPLRSQLRLLISWFHPICHDYNECNISGFWLVHWRDTCLWLANFDRLWRSTQTLTSHVTFSSERKVNSIQTMSW